MTFAQQLRKWRDARGMSRIDAGKILKCSPRTVEAYELRAKKPPTDKLEALLARMSKFPLKAAAKFAGGKSARSGAPKQAQRAGAPNGGRARASTGRAQARAK
jgi:transcriptional regulator with XRE-family HTH domain